MELRHLRYFVAVAESGGFSRAAEKLFIAQPPLSLQIRQLEETLGTALFTRHAKGARLTPAGEALLPQARDLLDRAARLRRPDARAAAVAAPTLTLGYVPSASSTVLPQLVPQLRRACPGLVLQLREQISDEQDEALAAGHIDAGLARARPRHARVAVACAVDDPLCLALPRAGLAGAAPAPPALPPPGQPVALRDYAAQDFVGFTRHRGPAYFDRAIHLCSQAGFSPRLRTESSTVHGVLDLVGAGLGVALVPASVALLRPRGVVLRRLSGRAAADELLLLRRKADAHPLLPVLQQAVQPLLQALARRTAQALDGPDARARRA